jgi:hypothetical protein
MRHGLLKFKAGIVMLVLSSMIIIPFISSFMSANHDLLMHSQGEQDHEIINSVMEEISEHCADGHTHHDLNFIVLISVFLPLIALGFIYGRPENDVLLSLTPLGIKRPP